MKFTGMTFIIIIAAAAGSFFSCSSRITGTLKETGAADFSIETRLEPRMTSLIRSFQAMIGPSGGEGGGGPEKILDGDSISRSMAAAPGMGFVSLRNTAPAALEGKVELAALGDFLAVAGREKRFVTFTENTGNPPGQGRVVISLDLETAPDVIALLSADAVAYLTALMAPAATGEVLSREQYLLLVSSLYGAAIADEISAAMITAIIDFPGPITSIRGGSANGSANGRRAEWNVPLLDLLVLDKPLVWEVLWRK